MMAEKKTCKICNEKYEYLNYNDICFSCEEEKNIKDLSETAVEDGETSNERYIVCPYCGEHYGEDDMYETQTVECDNCDKKFKVEVEYSVSYSTEKTDNGED